LSRRVPAPPAVRPRVAHSGASGLNYMSCDSPIERLRITDYVDKDGVVRGMTFEDKEIVGPAVLAPIGEGTRVSGCMFPHPPSAFVWEIPAGTTKYGLVGLVDCTFHRCTFSATIGFAVDPEQAKAMGAGMN
jgi:hypothetical protein